MPHKLPTQTHHTRTNTICSCPLAPSRLCAVSTMWACTIQPPLLKVELHFQPNRCHASDLKKKKKRTLYVCGNTTFRKSWHWYSEFPSNMSLVFHMQFFTQRHWESYSLQMQTIGLEKVLRSGTNTEKKKKALSSIPYALMMPAERKKDANAKW